MIKKSFLSNLSKMLLIPLLHMLVTQEEYLDVPSISQLNNFYLNGMTCQSEFSLTIDYLSRNRPVDSCFVDN